ncbi:MAG: PKD domain-containing protein [Candidatus Promineofilum sp.]|nr:PKD domain-containing protein [Promineifilum sp.]
MMTVLLGAALFVWRPSSSAVLYSGYARADSGSLSLEVIVNPPVGLPGTQMQMLTRVTNHGPLALTPSIVLRLPRSLSADMYALPAGATFNLQQNHIDWLPVVPAGSVVEFTLDLVAQTADVTNPEQPIVALLRLQGDEQEAAAPLWIGIAPLVGNVTSKSQVSVGQPMRLQADVAGPEPLTTSWDLGDGRKLDLSSPEVVFPTAGNHEITVEVANPGGRVVKHITLTVLPHPVASFRPDDDAPSVGQPVLFANMSGGQPPLRVFWDFGDGSTVMGEQQPTHVYAQGGTYRVRLTIENDFGQSEAMWDVSVGTAPAADMIIPDSVTVGAPLTGQAFGDDAVTRYIWDMGDGRQQEGATINHVYRRPGDYYVTMVADNGFGQTPIGRWVRVGPGTTSLFLPLAASEAGGDSSAMSADVPGVTELDPAVQALEDTFVLEPLQFANGTSPAEQLLAYMNAARARFDLPPMAYGFELSAAAQSHALDKSRFPDNPHVGTDGTTAAERLLRSGYGGGYAGEATAWGFSDPRLAIEFWMNSDSHRPLILNRLGTEVGIGYVEDFSTTNVWHWTAEFGIAYGAPVRPVLRALVPAAGYSALDTEVVNYSWMWPVKLASGERFTVYLKVGERLLPLGSIVQPVYGSRYVLSVDVRDILRSASSGAAPLGGTNWLVRLEDGLGNALAESETRVVAFTPDPNVIEATAIPTLSIVTATPALSTATPTPTLLPTSEPPGNEPPPVIVTATPVPTTTPEPSPSP